VAKLRLVAIPRQSIKRGAFFVGQFLREYWSHFQQRLHISQILQPFGTALRGVERAGVSFIWNGALITRPSPLWIT
jgi:hypothetical protein